MPVWSAWVLGASALIIATGVIIKTLRSGARLIATTDRMYPLLVELTTDPNIVRVLSDIAAQFRTDHGSSLRDVVNKLERSADDNHTMGLVLERLLERLTLKVEAGATTAQGVADNLAVAQKAVDDVAIDLALAHKRADEVHRADPPGAAADAASRQTQSEKNLTEKNLTDE